jgi:hypothetical protein
MGKRKHNLKKRLAPEPDESRRSVLAQRVAQLRYGGNPTHKRNPGDFGLVPPSAARRGKTLCDDAGILTHAIAESLLREGFSRGLVSVAEHDGWPQNIWAIAANDIVLEAMLDEHTQETAKYHGYPLLTGDPIEEVVRARWMP